MSSAPMSHGSQTAAAQAGLSQTGLSQTGPAHASGEEERSFAAPPAFVGISTALRRLLLQAEIAAPRLQCAVVEGEAGTGKHLFAQYLHHQSLALAKLPFQRRDARAWLATEAETAALSGTLYLDRVDLLAAGGQGLLLNLIKAVQSDAGHGLNFLLIASSHSSLRQLAGAGQFLPDLAFRLTAARFLLPPLREHREDIAPISQALMDRICRRYQQPAAVLAPGTLPRLLKHNWPGNVRELASILESAILNSTSGVLRPADLNLDVAGHAYRAESMGDDTAGERAAVTEADQSLDAVIRRHIQQVLDLNRGNKLRAARQLGISRSTLYRLLAGETNLAS